MSAIYTHPANASQVDEEDVAWRIVEAIKHGYVKKPWASVSPRGYVTVRCKLKYMKYGNRAFSIYGGKEPWRDTFHNLFIQNRGIGKYTDDYFPVTRDASERVRALVISALGEKVVKDFCEQMVEARAKADVFGAKRKHEKRLARRRFKDKALEAAKQGLSREEMLEIVNEAMINDVMTE